MKIIKNNDVINLYKKGLINKEIAKELNCSNSYISRILKSMQLEPNESNKDYSKCYICGNACVSKCCKIGSGRYDFDFIKKVEVTPNRYPYIDEITNEKKYYDGINIMECENFIPDEIRLIEVEDDEIN